MNTPPAAQTEAGEPIAILSRRTQPQSLVPGRIVHYVNSQGHTVPAIIVIPNVLLGESKLCVFYSSGPSMEDAKYDNDGVKKTWHWMFEGQENRYRSDPPSEMPEMKIPAEKLYPVAITLDQVRKVVKDTMLEMGEARVPEVLKSLDQMEGVVNAVVQKREVPLVDPWAHRSSKMKCATCMWFVQKVTFQKTASVGKSEEILNDVTTATNLGRCRRHSPTLGGYPVVFTTDWCGDHKLDETKA